MPEAISPTASFAPSLLIAVTGGPGAGKTSLLSDLARTLTGGGRRVEGVLAPAGRRPMPDQPAEEYWLRIVGTEDELSWAVRDESSNPPYSFEPETERRLRNWARQLPRRIPVLLMDEFGKLELAGRGLMPVWPLLVDAQPQIVVIAVREELVDRIEGLLGRPFDLRIAASSPDALLRLQRAAEDYGEWTRLGLIGGASGGVEMSVGSMLHAAHIPGTGLILCSLQGVMMTFAGFGLAQPGRVIWVPFISAGLKALSPAGSRVRPMIAICAQGLLYGGAVQTLGWNAWGVTAGGALIGAWSVLQGFVLQYLFLGGELTRAYDTVVLMMADRWGVTAPSLPWLVVAWAISCAVLSGGFSFAAWRLRTPPAALQRLIEQEKSRESVAPRRAKTRLHELAHWQFWLPLLIVGGILLATGRSWESVAWLALRFVAVGFLLLTLVSLVRPARWAEHLRRLGWWGPALAMSGAFSRRATDKK